MVFIDRKKKSFILGILVGINLFAFLSFSIKKVKLEGATRNAVGHEMEELGTLVSDFSREFQDVYEMIDGYNYQRKNIDELLLRKEVDQAVLYSKEINEKVKDIALLINIQEADTIEGEMISFSNAMIEVWRDNDLGKDELKELLGISEKYISTLRQIIEEQKAQFNKNHKIDVDEFQKIYMNKEIELLEEWYRYDR